MTAYSASSGIHRGRLVRRMYSSLGSEMTLRTDSGDISIVCDEAIMRTGCGLYPTVQTVVHLVENQDGPDELMRIGSWLPRGDGLFHLIWAPPNDTPRVYKDELGFDDALLEDDCS